MRWYRAVLELRAPVLVGGEGYDGVVRDTREWIPGSVWRGAFIQELLRDQGCLREWNRSGGRTCPSCDRTGSCQLPPLLYEARFLPLLPANRPARGEEAADAGATGPAHFDVRLFRAPLSARVCKRDGQHPLQDLLRAGLAGHITKHGQPDAKLPGLPTCPTCGGRLDRLRGTVEQRGQGPHLSFRMVSVKKRLETKVGLSRRTGRAEEQILFAVRPITNINADASVFVGSLAVPDAVAAWLGNAYPISLGGGKARGFGSGTLRLLPMRQPADVDQRLQHFQPKVGAALLDPAHVYFCLDVQSPAVLFDDSAAPARHLTVEVLGRYCPPEFTELLQNTESVQLCYTEQVGVSGWSQTWGLYKPVVFAIAPGSVFTYRVPAEYRDQLVRLLAWLEDMGLGEYRAQGFGQVEACHWFHICAGGGSDASH